MDFQETLRQELLAMRERDQQMRIVMMAKYQSGETLRPEDHAYWLRVDAENTQRMQEIVAAWGWPGESLVGKDGAETAWLLAQHADHALDFQKQCLDLLRAAVATSEASVKNLAFLTDRVRVNEGLPQVYGTQCHTVDGELVSREIEDAAGVDERRAMVGLGPIEEYLASMRA